MLNDKATNVALVPGLRREAFNLTFQVSRPPLVRLGRHPEANLEVVGEGGEMGVMPTC